MGKRTAVEAGIASNGDTRGKKKKKGRADEQPDRPAAPKPKREERYAREKALRDEKRQQRLKRSANGTHLPISDANAVVIKKPKTDASEGADPAAKSEIKAQLKAEKAKRKLERKETHKRLKAEKKQRKRLAKLEAKKAAAETAPETEANDEGKPPKEPSKKDLRKAERKAEFEKKKAEKEAKKAAKTNGEDAPADGATSESTEVSDAAPVNGVASEDTDMPDAAPASDDNAQLEKASKEAKRAAKKEKKEKKAKKDAPEDSPAVETNGVDDVEQPCESADPEAEAAGKRSKKASKKDKKESKKDRKEKNEPADTAPAPPTSGELSSASEVPASGYAEDPALAALPQSEVDAFLSKHFIAVTDPLNTATKFRPIVSFSHLPVTDESLRAPFKNFSAPTPIQAAAWPSLFAGRDVIGVAETGSGKTLGFGVPCIRHIMSLPKKESKGVKAVIVSPTRELASQIHEQLVKLAEPAGLKSVCIYGGVPKDEQKLGLKKANIVVATPGRLNDLIDEGAADISKANYVVLDEADRMLDKGFEDAIRKIISSTRPISERQTLMFTATWPKSVQELASTFMKSPVKITIGDNPTGELRANTRISQTVEVVEPRDKEYRLFQLLKEHTAGNKKNDRILVFCLYKKEATRVENFIRQKGFKVAGIHGDLSQVQRTASLDKFKKGEIPILVATDVAARGLDIPAVKLVINVTFPLTAEDYVHRIGRTGRAGQDGKAITLFTDHDKALAGALVNVLKGANQPVPEDLMKFGTTVKKKGHDAYGAFYKDTTDMKAATKITFDD